MVSSISPNFAPVNIEVINIKKIGTILTKKRKKVFYLFYEI